MTRMTISPHLEANRSRDLAARHQELVVSMLDEVSRRLCVTTALLYKEKVYRVRTIHGSTRHGIGTWMKNQGWFWAALGDTSFPLVAATTVGHPLFQPVVKAARSGAPEESIGSMLAVAVEGPGTDRGLKTILAAFGETARSWTKDELECLEAHAALFHSHESLRTEVERLKSERNVFAALENGWQKLIEQSLDLVTRQGLDGVITKVSILQEPALGHSPCDLVGKRLKDFVHPDDQRRFQERFEAIVDGREVSRISYRFRRRDDSLAWLETSVVPVFDPFTGALSEVICGSRDISDRVSSPRFDAERTTLESISWGTSPRSSG